MSTDEALLEQRFFDTGKEVGVSTPDAKDITTFLAPLRVKHPPTYFHSLRVAILAQAIARHQHLDRRALFFAGALHDIGKALVALTTLGRTDAWTAQDQRIMQRHVLDGYRLLKGRFDFTAEVMLWHHRFQVRGYPKRLPPPLHSYSVATHALITEYGRLLAIADVYDALHRRNSKIKTGGHLTRDEIQSQMLSFNPDRRALIHSLYETHILT